MAGKSDLLKSGFWSLFLTLAFFLSWLFVFLTPIPLMYAFFKQGSRVWTRVVVPALILLIPLYLFALDPLYQFYEKSPQWSWVLPIPGMGFRDQTSLMTVCAYGWSTFLFYVFVAYIGAQLFTHRKDHIQILGRGVVWSYLAALILLTVFTSINGQGPMVTAYHFMESFYNEMLVYQKEMGQSMEQVAFLSQYLNEYIFYSTALLPALLFCILSFQFSFWLLTPLRE